MTGSIGVTRRKDRTRIAEFESPNTVSGLIAKRDELLREQRRIEDDLRRVTSDICHLEGAIQLFDPNATPASAKRYALKYRAKAGHVTRFLLDQLRQATEPVNSLDLTQKWMAERAMPTHQATYVIIRARISSCLAKLTRDGVVRVIETGKWRKLYELVGD